MRTRCVSVLCGCVLSGTLVGCPGTPSKDAPAAKTEPVDVRPRPESIKKVKEGAQKANEAAVQRTDDAVDRAMKGETVERGAPEPR